MTGEEETTTLNTKLINIKMLFFQMLNNPREFYHFKNNINLNLIILILDFCDEGFLFNVNGRCINVTVASTRLATFKTGETAFLGFWRQFISPGLVFYKMLYIKINVMTLADVC